MKESLRFLKIPWDRMEQMSDELCRQMEEIAKEHSFNGYNVLGMSQDRDAVVVLVQFVQLPVEAV